MSAKLLQLLERFGLAGAGSWVDGKLLTGSGATVRLLNPVNGETLLSYASADERVVAQAAESAERAQQRWWALAASARGEALYALSRRIQQHADDIALLEALTVGKPLRDARTETAAVAKMFSYYAGWCDKLYGDVIPVPTSHLNYTLPEPYGVVLQMTPWNAPLFTAGWQVAPALCAGNAALLKPSELTPLSSLVLAKLALAAGLPAGLFNVLAGDGVGTGQLAIRHPATRKVVFVGSPAGGALVAKAAAENVVPCLLELGGKSANIVFADADLARAAVGAQAAVFAGAGQSCVAGSRLLVQASVYDRLVTAVAKAAGRLKVGDPLDPATEIGPLQNARQYARVQDLVAQGLSQGARPLSGGDRPLGYDDSAGYFYAPTVLADVGNTMAVAREEIFGPVLSAIRFEDEDDAVRLANDSAFGLAGAVWTNNVGRAHRVAQRVRAGTFWINGYKTINVQSPFGGFRASGYGRSSGREGLAEYTQSKSVWVETAAEPVTGFGYMPDGVE